MAGDDPFEYIAPVRVQSPCVNICAIDPVTDWCIGCARSGAEIEEWFDATEARRQSILDALPERIEALKAR